MSIGKKILEEEKRLDLAIEENRIRERENREIREIIQVVASAAEHFILGGLTVDSVIKKELDESFVSSFIFPNAILTLEVNLALKPKGKKKKSSRVKKSG